MFEKKKLELVNEFSKVTGYNNPQKLVIILKTWNELMETDFENMIPFIFPKKRICLGINLAKCVQDVFAENYKMLMK